MARTVHTLQLNIGLFKAPGRSVTTTARPSKYVWTTDPIALVEGKERLAFLEDGQSATLPINKDNVWIFERTDQRVFNPYTEKFDIWVYQYTGRQ